MKFKYSIPDYKKRLSPLSKTILDLGALSEQLAAEERFFLVAHASGRNENDSEHAHMLTRVAPIIAMRYYPKLNPGLTSLYATVHDDIEAYVGDVPTHELTDEVESHKTGLEKKGLEQLLKEYAHIPEYISLLLAYEEQKDPESRFVRMLDKVMTLNMHIFNAGAPLHDYWTKDEFLKFANSKTERYKKQYPDFIEVLEARAELIQYVATEIYK